MRHPVVLCLVLLGCVTARAATLYWDPAASFTGTGSGGNGTWYPASAVWYPGSDAADQVWAASSTAVFSGNPGWVVLNSTQYGGLTANALTFTRTDYFFENTSYTGSATHTVGTLSFGTGLFTYHVDYNGVTASDAWNVTTASVSQGSAVMFYYNNLGLYKNENHSVFSITNRDGLGLVGSGAAFVTGAPNYNVSVIPSMVYAKYMHLPYYTFVGYDTTNNSLRALVSGAENNSQQCPVFPPTTAADNVRIGTPQAVNAATTINSLVLDGCGYYVNSTADITGTGALTISSGGLMYLRAPEHFSNAVVFPSGIEGHLFIGNGHVWTTNQVAFSPTIRSAFSGDHGLTITGQPDYTYVYPNQVTTVYNADPVTLTGASTYTGVTTINAAKVITSVPANFGNSNMLVLNAGATLAPTADNFLSTSQSLTLDPGSILDAAGRTTTVNNVILNAGSTGVTLHSTTQLKPLGTATVTGATLNLVLDAAPSASQQFTLVSGAQTITGALAQGATLHASFGGTQYTFGVAYSSGNLVLTEGGNPPPANPPVITTPLADEFAFTNLWAMVNSPFSYQIVATNSPTGYTAAGLPAGLTVNPTTGLISGTPTAQGNSTVTVTATNAKGTAQATWTFKVLGATIYTGSTTLAPYTGTAAAIPGRIFCVDYDFGGEGVAYHDDDVGNHYAAEGCAWYRIPHDDVDMPDRAGDTYTQGGMIVGVHGNAGEWLKYSLNVTQSGTYTIEVRSATITDGAQVHFEIDDTPAGSPVTLPNTNNYNVFATASTTGVNLSTGPHILKFCIDNNNGMSLNWINFVRTGGTSTAPEITSATTASGTVGQAFTYQIAASNAPLSLNATNLPGWLSLGATGALTGTPTAVGVFTASLSATNDAGTGTATLTITVTDGGGPPPGYTGTPYLGTAAAIPGQILAVNFDNGGEGVAYHDDTATDVYGNFMRTTDVDIFTSSDTGGGFCLSGLNGGEWLNYTVSVATTGTYTAQFRSSEGNGPGTVHLEVDGTNVSGPVVLPNTGNWTIWTTTAVTNINLTAGQHILRLCADTAGTQLNWINFVLTSATNSAPAISSATAASGTVGTAFTYQIAGSNTPTGFAAPNLPAGLAVNTGTGAITGTPTAAGSFTVTISATNATGTGTATLTITIAKASQTIDFPALTSRTLAQSPFAPAATASSGLTVTFTVVSGPAQSDGTTVTLTGPGQVTLRASQAGNANYTAAADVQQSFAVTIGNQQITFNPPGVHLFPGTVTLAAAATSSLPVHFEVASGPATLNGNVVTLTGYGLVVINATQAGNANWSAAATVTQSFLSAGPLTVTKLTGTFKFSGKTSGKDSCALTAAITNPPVGFTLANKTCSLDVGGAQANFTFDGKGKPRKTAGAALNAKITGGQVLLSAKLTGTFSDDWQDEGVSSAGNPTKKPMSVTVLVTLDGVSYFAAVNTQLTSKAGKGGGFKQPPVRR